MPRKDISTDEIEKRISAKLSEARLASGITGSALAKKIGVTHQQMHKYINGSNRITAGRLHFIAKALKLPISYFFEEDKGCINTSQRLYLEVLRNFSNLSKTKQKAVAELIDKISGE